MRIMTREDDIDAGRVKPGVKRAMVPYDQRIRIKTHDGKYLHFSGEGYTRDLTNAWLGVQAQADKMLKKLENVEGIHLERYRTTAIDTATPVKRR
jgi:hypothetical protein